MNPGRDPLRRFTIAERRFFSAKTILLISGILAAILISVDMVPSIVEIKQLTNMVLSPMSQ
jgi:hypothetical protein